MHDHVAMGPCMLEIPVLFLDVDFSAWLEGCGVPGVKVVEGQLKSMVSGPRHGVVRVEVEPGVRLVLAQHQVPWRLRGMTVDDGMALAVSKTETARLSRQNAHVSQHRYGWIRNAEGERALSVRINDRCDEKHKSHWVRLDCGHVFCKMCDGTVCPETLNALKGPGPIIKCVRLPWGFDQYKWLVRFGNYVDKSMIQVFKDFLGSKSVVDFGDKRLAPLQSVV